MCRRELFFPREFCKLLTANERYCMANDTTRLATVALFGFVYYLLHGIGCCMVWLYHLRMEVAWRWFILEP